MSKFHTSIPIDINAAFAKLPIGSRVVNYTLDQAKRELAVEWENDNLKTPYSVPIPYTLEDLQAGVLPASTKASFDYSNLPATELEKPSETSTFNDKVKLDNVPEKRNKSRK